MADKKISALTGATTPLAGTEVLPIVQGGSTVKVSVENLTAGRAVAMAGGSFTDNLVQGTAAKGVNFTANTPAAGMTSQLLNWYEEGTWTPGQGTGLTVVGAFTSVGTYTRVGRQVTVCGNVEGATSVTMAAGQLCTGMPFSANVTVNISTGSVLNNTITQSGSCLAVGTQLFSSSFGTVKQLTFTCTYFI